MTGLKSRVYTLDLLRFAAAFAVVLYHYTSRPDGAFDLLSTVTRFGYLGVPVFFMISGFVITLSASGRSAYQFCVSRFARLYPALWVGLLFTVMTAYLLTGDRTDLWTILANATLLNDYIGQPDIDGVYWTLHAELKFYCCVFLLVATGLFKHFKLWLSAWLALTVAHMVTGQPWFMGWFISPSWSPFFITGVSIYLIQDQGANRFNVGVLTGALLLATIRAFISAESFISSPSHTESAIAAGVVLLFAATLLAIAMGKLEVPHASWVVTAGAMTYPLYLIHNRAGKAIIDSLPVPEWLGVSLVIVFMLVAAFGIYRFIERPTGNWIRQFCFSLPERISIRARTEREPD